MSIDTLLIGPTGHGGEEVYTRTLSAYPPPEVRYSVAGTFHHGAPGASCSLATEMMLNRVVRPLAVPDIGFRALRLRRPFDLVHVHAHPVIIRARTGTPLVMSEGSSSAVYLSDYLGWDADKLARRYERSRRVYRVMGIHDRLLAQDKVSRVYVFSHWARDVNIRWGADPTKTDVVYPGFPTPPEPAPVKREEFRFLFVGGDFERKGGVEVVEAFDEVIGHAPHARLTLVTADPSMPNPDRRFHGWVDAGRRNAALARLAELRRRGHVELLPLVDRDHLYKACYANADAYVMPTHAEGLGFTNIEALGFGLPVISSTVGPIPEVVTDGVTGLLSMAGDVPALTEAMLRLAGDLGEARRLGAAARNDFMARFTLDRFREAVGGVYRRALRS